MSHRSSMGPWSSASSDSPSTLNTWPRTASPTGTARPRPRLRTVVPRRRPSVGLRQMQRTRPSPICWATSEVTVILVPSSSRSISTAMLISGRPWGGNSTSTTGPAMATTRPSGRLEPLVVAGSVIVVVMRPVLSCRSCAEGCRSRPLFGAGRLTQCLGATDDLHDLGGDGVLTGPVHHPGQGLDQVVGVVGGGRHGPLTGRVLAGRGLEQRPEDGRFHVARHQVDQQLGRFGLEFGVAQRGRPLLVAGRLGQRQELTGLHHLGPGRQESGGDEEYLVHLLVEEGRGDDGGDSPG